MTLVGTRSEIIRLSRVLARLDEHCEHVTGHTGQDYDNELSQIFFDDLGIRKPGHFLNAAGGSAAETIDSAVKQASPAIDGVGGFKFVIPVWRA